jgi:transcription antitermination factor NusG
MRLTGFGDAWFAIQVRARSEKMVASMLESKGYEKVVPTYQPKPERSPAEMPLFPGYVFCRFRTDARAPIITTPGVIRIVGYGKQPVSIPECEIEAICRVAHSGIGAQPHPFVRNGQRVRISDGPLRGVVGKVLAFGERSLLIVSVTLLERSIAVKVESRWVTPLDDSSYCPEAFAS